ncbi:MAG TPA: methyltransferase domain-containing protein [Myxococcota bacterium]|nr:methyltransferase domain-containing protein [Myxococcota bacterium]
MGASKVKLNLGCGPRTPDGWIHVDYAWGARLARLPFFRALNRRIRLFDLDWSERIQLHDLTRRFPWRDASADVVYSSHTLEHFSREDGRAFLTECQRVLRKGGILRIVVPDLRRNVLAYLEGQVPADDFVESLGVLHGRTPSRLKNRLAPFVQFPHKCMYDGPRLLQILDEIGFEASARAAFESDIDDIRQVESADRTNDAVIVEGRKR